MIKIEVVNNFGDFLKLENIWNNLLTKCTSNYVFSTFEWFKCWITAFGKNKNIYIILIKDADNIIGIAPLMITEKKYLFFSVKLLTFIYNDNSSHADFIFEKGKESVCLEAVMNHLKQESKLWNKIYFENIPTESPNWVIMDALSKQNNILIGKKSGLNSPYIMTNFKWEDYCKQQSRKFRKNINNLTNRMKKWPDISIKNFTSEKDNSELMKELIYISSKSWKKKIKGHIDHTPENLKFFEELVKTSEQNQWLSSWILYSGKQPVAYEFLLRYNNKLFGLRADFDEAFKTTGAGNMIHLEILTDCFKNGLNEYDLCGHEDPYKMVWTEKSRPHYKIVIYKNNFLGKIFFNLDYNFIYKIIGFLRNFESLRQIKKKLQTV